MFGFQDIRFHHHLKKNDFGTEFVINILWKIFMIPSSIACIKTDPFSHVAFIPKRTTIIYDRSFLSPFRHMLSWYGNCRSIRIRKRSIFIFISFNKIDRWWYLKMNWIRLDWRILFDSKTHIQLNLDNPFEKFQNFVFQ